MAPPVGRRHVSRRLVLLVWLIVALVAVAVFGTWIVSTMNEPAPPTPVMHIGPPATGADVAVTRTTFRDLTNPEHPRTWTLEKAYRTRAVDARAIVEPR
jgi:hypothetical protein